MEELYKKTAVDISRLINEKKLSVREVANYFFHRCKTIGKKINAITYLDETYLNNEISRVESLIEKNQGLPLAGVPVLVKDNISVEGIPMTCGSKMLKNFRPCFDATAIKKLKASGAIILGKTNMDEFGMGSSNEYSVFGPVLNPWDNKRVSGGSSGGSAAAVAAKLAPLALGSDTGGSIRQPASFCGVMGFKPSYGQVSRYGLTAYGSSLEQIGPFANSIEDISLVHKVLESWDPLDSSSKKQSRNKVVTAKKKLRIGVLTELSQEGISSQVKQQITQAIEALKKAGYDVEPLSVPAIKYAVPIYYIIALAEASSNLTRYDGMAYGFSEREEGKGLNEMYKDSRSKAFGAEVKKRIMLGTFILSGGYSEKFYQKATVARSKLKKEFAEIFKKYDILLGASSPTEAFSLGEKTKDPIAMLLSDICTTPANLIQSPAMSMPCGLSESRLPVGIQLIGAPEKDLDVLSFAKEFQEIMKEELISEEICLEGI